MEAQAALGCKLAPPIPKGTEMTDVRQKKWIVGKSIGAGAFGAIYLASLSGCEEEEYVVKVEPHSNGPLWVEMHAFLRLGLDSHRATHKPRNGKPQGWVGIPEYFGSGSFHLGEDKLRFLVMSRLGSDIEKFFLGGQKPLPLSTALNISIQILESLEYIHSRNYCHNDIKAQNVLLGRGQDQDSVYLVDLGLACKYRGSSGFHHDAGPDERKAHEGTLLYTSRDAHIGAHSRRGDLETLGYNLVHWVAGYLPWIHSDIPEHVQAKKIGYMYNVAAFLKKCFKPDKPPKVLEDFLVYVNSLEFEDAPNYSKLRKLLLQEMRKEGVEPYAPLVFGKRRREEREESSDEDEEEVLEPEKTRNTRSQDDEDRFAPWSWEQVLCQDPESIIRQASRSSENQDEENPVKTAAFQEEQALSLENPTPAMLKLLDARMDAEAARMNLSWMDQLKEYNNKAALTKARFANMDLTPSYLTPAMQEVIDNRAKRLATGVCSPITPDASEDEDNTEDSKRQIVEEKSKKPIRKRRGGASSRANSTTPTSAPAAYTSTPKAASATSTPTTSARSSRTNSVTPGSSRPTTPNSPLLTGLEQPSRTPTPVFGERITRSRASSRASSPEDCWDFATPTRDNPNPGRTRSTRSRSATKSPVSRPQTPDFGSGRLSGIEEVEEGGIKIFKKPLSSSKVECSICGKRLLPRSLQTHIDKLHSQKPEDKLHSQKPEAESEAATKRIGSPKTPVVLVKRIRDNRHYTPLPNQEQEILPRRRRSPAKSHSPVPPAHKPADKEEDECPLCTVRMPSHLIPQHFSDVHSPARKVTRNFNKTTSIQTTVGSVPVHVSTDSPLKIRNVNSPHKEGGAAVVDDSVKRRELKL